jgi:ribonuclease HI
MSKHDTIKKIYVDGSGDGIVCIMFEGSKKPILEKHQTKTHNESEWQALYSGLTQIKSYDRYVIYSDSQLIVRQFNEEYDTKNPSMRNWKQRCRRYINRYGLDVKVQWISREENPAGKYLDQHTRFHIDD